MPYTLCIPAGDKTVMVPEYLSQYKEDSQAETSGVDLGADVDGLMNVVSKGMEQEVQPYGIALVELSLLRICMEQTEATTTDLAEVLPVDASRISRMVNGLVERGLLIMHRLRNDRKIVMLRLSEQGKEMTSMLHQRIQAHGAKLTENIGEEYLRKFEAVGSQIVANYAAMKPQP